MFSKADQALALFAASHHGVFRYDDARSCGLSADQAHYRSMCAWERLYEGVFRMPGVAPSLRGEMLAACFAVSGPVAVSHRSAAELYELPGRRADLIEIRCKRWERTRKDGLVVHESTRFDDRDVAIVDGIPVSTPERVILELAGLKPFPNYVEAVIHAARRKRLITYESTMETFQRLARRGVRGVKAMRIALERWDPESRVTHSNPEIDLVQVLRSHGLPEPLTQFEVLDEHGSFVACVDLAYPRWRIVIEYDSKREHSDEFQIARDERRRNQITAAGYTYLVARWNDIRSGGDALADEIRRVVRRAS